MARYIEAANAAEIISDKLDIALSELVDVMATVPTADVQEVKRGEWQEDVLDNIICSACGESFNICDNDTERFIYCPNCGAKCVEEKER